MTEKRFSVKKSESGLFYRDGDYEIDNTIQFIIETVEMKLNQLSDENEELKFENNELKCALALNAVDYIIADGKKIDIPPYYEFEQRHDYVMHRREYDGYD